MPKEVSKLVQQMANRSRVGKQGIYHKPTDKGSIDLVKVIMEMAKDTSRGNKSKEKAKR